MRGWIEYGPPRAIAASREEMAVVEVNDGKHNGLALIFLHFQNKIK